MTSCLHKTIVVSAPAVADDGASYFFVLAFAGVAARDGYFDKLAPGTMGGTYGGNAVSCAAAAATIDVSLGFRV